MTCADPISRAAGGPACAALPLAARDSGCPEADDGAVPPSASGRGRVFGEDGAGPVAEALPPRSADGAAAPSRRSAAGAVRSWTAGDRRLSGDDGCVLDVSAATGSSAPAGVPAVAWSTHRAMKPSSPIRSRRDQAAVSRRRPAVGRGALASADRRRPLLVTTTLLGRASGPHRSRGVSREIGCTRPDIVRPIREKINSD